MHRMKKTILPLLLALAMALSTVISASAAKSPTTTALKKVTVAKASYGYTGKAQKPKVTVTDKNGKKVAASNYTVSYKANKKLGTATVTVKGKGSYTGTVKTTFKIAKGTQSKLKVTLKGRTKIKESKKKHKIGWIKYKHHHGKIAYKSNYKKIKVTKNGQVYVLKGAKKGTYKITFKAYKAKNYKDATKTITIVLK